LQLAYRELFSGASQVKIGVEGTVIVFIFQNIKMKETGATFDENALYLFTSSMSRDIRVHAVATTG
jgi:hypothetical protein